MVSASWPTHEQLRAFKDVFFRTGLPNLVNLAATAAVALAVVYFQKWRIELPVSSSLVFFVQGVCLLLPDPFFLSVLLFFFPILFLFFGGVTSPVAQARLSPCCGYAWKSSVTPTGAATAVRRGYQRRKNSDQRGGGGGAC